MSVELRHLRAFVAAAEELHFSAAAQRLHLTQQALSRTVSQLEQLVGTPLFERTTRHVTLTAAGEAMLPSARRALVASAKAVDAARGTDARPLKVDISSGGIETGALVLRRLRRDHPHIAVEQVEVGVRRGKRLLGDGALDILLGLADDPPGHLGIEALRVEQVLVGMAQDHPLAAGAEVPLRGLEGIPLLLPSDEAAGEWTAFVLMELRRAGVSPRRYAGTTHGSVAAAEVMREGACVVPTLAWTDPPPDLVFRPLGERAFLFPWSMMWLEGGHERAEVSAFLAAARGVASERGWLRQL